MASIRKRGSSYLIVVSMGYDYNGNRINPQQKTVRPPKGLTPKQLEKWLQEQAILFEMDCKNGSHQVNKSITLGKYVELWLRDIAPNKLAKSTLNRDRQDIDRFLPVLGHHKLTDLRPEHFRNYYAQLRKTVSTETKKPLSESTVEGVHATLCSILSDAVEGGFLSHNPAWRTYRYAGRKCEKKIADEETAQKIIAALEGEYESIRLAMDALESANATLQNRFSPELGRRAAEIFSALTDGKYSGVVLDRAFHLSAEQAGDSVYRPSALLSAGAADQLYLAVRLAICDLVLPGEEPAPIVLDDALASFDNDRCAAALRWLKEEGKRRQILLFTCHSREAAFFAGDGEVSVQRLTADA